MSEVSSPEPILLAVPTATDMALPPARDPLAYPRHAMTHERRRALVHGGVPWASERVLPGLDDAAPKQVHQAWDGLARQALLTLAAAKPECECEISDIPLPISPMSPRQEAAP